jgi:hypothetical protein
LSLAVATCGAVRLASPFTARADAGVKAGFAQVDVSTETSLTMGGYGVHVGFGGGVTRRSDGVHDPLLASAVAFEGADGRGVAIVSLDAVGVSPLTARRVRERVAARVPTDKVFVSVTATHSHHTPDTMGLWGALPFSSGRDANYMEVLEAAAAAALARAWESRVEAVVAYGVSRYANSSSAEPRTDQRNDQFVTILARDTSGEVLGTFTQWSAHPTILPESNRALSADFVGSYRAFLGRRFPGVHVYANGVIGGVYPAETQRREPDPFPQGRKDPALTDIYDRVAATGLELAEVAAQALDDARPLPDAHFSGASRTFSFPLVNKLFAWASGLGLIETRVGPSNSLTSEISLVSLGGLTLVGVPGEIFPTAAEELAEELAVLPGGGRVPKFPEAKPLYLGIANDWIGYIMSRSDLANSGLAYNRALSPGAKALPRMREALRALVKDAQPGEARPRGRSDAAR